MMYSMALLFRIALAFLSVSTLGNECCTTVIAGRVANAYSAEIKVEVLIPPGMPITIDVATVEKRTASGLLKCRITNHSDEAIKLVQANLSFHRLDILAKTSYGLGYDWNLSPRSSKEVTTEIAKEPTEDEIPFIVVTEVESENSLWRAGGLKLYDAIRNYIKGKPYVLPKAEWWEVVKKPKIILEIRDYCAGVCDRPRRLIWFRLYEDRETEFETSFEIDIYKGPGCCAMSERQGRLSVEEFAAITDLIKRTDFVSAEKEYKKLLKLQDSMLVRSIQYRTYTGEMKQTLIENYSEGAAKGRRYYAGSMIRLIERIREKWSKPRV